MGGVGERGFVVRWLVGIVFLERVIVVGTGVVVEGGHCA